MTRFDLPDLGEGLHEAELVAWHVTIGDHVVMDQPLASVETDKAVVEIPAPLSGQVARLHGSPGDILSVGSPFVDFEENGKIDAGTVVGSLPTGEPESAEPSLDISKRHKVFASPAVRSLARKLGVGLSTLSGSGPDGAVTLNDVESAAEKPAHDGAKVQPLRGVRRAMAIRMAEAHAEVVPATVTDLAEVTSWGENKDVSLRLVRAIARAVGTVPALNAWYLGLEKGRIVHEHIHLGIAMDSNDGLFVPTLRDIANRDAADIRRALERLKTDVGARKIALEDLRGQTITLSNFGTHGGRHAALVVLPPQVAILGAGRIYNTVVAQPFGLEVARMLPLSLTFDHRAVTGGEAAKFLNAIVQDLQAPS